MIDRSDMIRSQAVHQVLVALGGSPLHVFGDSRSPRIAQVGLDQVVQEFTFREGDRDWVYEVTAEITVRKDPA